MSRANLQPARLALLTGDLTGVRIRPMQAADLEATVAAIRDGGWGERRASLAFFLQHAQAQPFVAEADGAIVGTGVAVQNGLVGWVGLIFTAPAMRGRGLGGVLTQTVVQHLRAGRLSQPVAGRDWDWGNRCTPGLGLCLRAATRRGVARRGRSATGWLIPGCAG